MSRKTDEDMRVNRHIAEGTKAHALGVKWYNNPHEAGSVAAYDWDKGHTIARREADPFGIISLFDLTVQDVRRDIESGNLDSAIKSLVSLKDVLEEQRDGPTI